MSNVSFSPIAVYMGILGQADPDATTETDLYTVPNGRCARAYVIITNRSVAGTVRISLGVDGESTSAKQYIAYNFALDANDSRASVEFMVSEGDIVRVYADSTDFSFTCTGTEQDL